MASLKFRNEKTGEWKKVGMGKLGTHADSHKVGGTDPLTPADIGAPTKEEVQIAINSAIGGAIAASY